MLYRSPEVFKHLHIGLRHIYVRYPGRFQSVLLPASARILLKYSPANVRALLSGLNILFSLLQHIARTHKQGGFEP